jgi:chromosome segregation ATPase
MEQEIQKLQERLAKAKEVFREMSAKDKEKDARIVELEAQLAEAVANANNNATEGEDAIADLTAQLRTMEERWRNADEFAIKYGSEVKMLNETIETMRFDLMKATGERDRIQMDYDKLNETATPILAMNTELTTQNGTLKSEVIELRNSNEFLVAEKGRLIGELDAAQEYVAKRDVQFENLQKAFNDERANVITLNGNIKELEDRLSNAQEDINDQANYITNLVESNKEKDQTIVSLESRIKILNDELAKTKHDKDVIKETVTKHVATIKKSMQGLNDGLGVEFDIFGN